MPILKKEDFYNSYFQKDKTFEYYSKIDYIHNNKIFYNKASTTNKQKAYAISLFPNYFHPELLNNSYNIKKTVQKNLNGYAILTNEYNNIIEYLQNNIKSKTREPILRRIKRLESCFNIEYKLFHGNISKELYDTALSKLKEMLLSRFAQKKDSTEVLDKWEHYEKTTFEAVKNKTASLFMIYANNEIIGISINYHIKDIFIGHIFCYDINFSKFSLGNTMVYKLLEWCFEKKYSMLDMGNGDLEYKQIWCNLTYNYEYHFIYKKKSIPGFILAHSEILKIKIKNTLKHYKIDKVYAYIKKALKGTTIPDANLPFNYTIEPFNLESINLSGTTKIDFSKSPHLHMKKPINDFLYTEQEHIDNLEVFVINETNYILKGTKKANKIILSL
jgi:hypothetical protein